ncbi:MAG: sensor histidine kinase [Scytonematopsis contorta HA4267-MV1]|jgi:signal transduction histidine kinase|nr:sensor histidine kinase [Scytonematopsis contorta HA4267-MV1]
MEVTAQDLAASVHTTSSPANSYCQAFEADVRTICKLQIEQLVNGLDPTVAAYAVYKDSHSQRRQLVEAVTANYPYIPDIQKYSLLQEQEWLTRYFPVLEVIKLNFSDIKHVYVCFLSDSTSQEPEYIFLSKYEPLTPSQENLLLKNAQLLSYHLMMQRQLSRQTAEIASLSHALGRTEHQLRHPLAMIHLFAENLRLALPTGELQEQAALIRETVDEICVNLTNLLCGGQRAQQQVVQYDLRTILDQTVQVLQPLLEEKHLQICYPNQSVSLAIDRWQMKQVFENLLSNAVYFSPNGEVITCNWQVYSHEVLVTISNQGAAIPTADLKQIFQPYFSRRLGGTGLGLAIAHKIILDHQGNLWVENLAKGGVQFSFTLPQ